VALVDREREEEKELPTVEDSELSSIVDSEDGPSPCQKMPCKPIDSTGWCCRRTGFEKEKEGVSIMSGRRRSICLFLLVMIQLM